MPKKSLSKITIKYTVNDGAFYSESIVLDKVKDLIKITQDNALTTKKTQEFFFRNNEVARLIEDIFVLSKNNKWKNFDNKVTKTCKESFSLIFDFNDKTKEQICGIYKAENLPADWNLMIKIINNLISPTTQNNIKLLDFNFVTPEEQKPYIYTKVSFDVYKGDYFWFRTQDNSIKKGDKVLVPNGEEDLERRGIVVSVHRYSLEEVPISLELVKSIICKYKDRVIIQKEILKKLFKKKVLVESFDNRFYFGVLKSQYIDNLTDFNDTIITIKNSKGEYNIPVYNIKNIKKSRHNICI